MLIYTTFSWHNILSSFFTATQYLNFGYIKCNPYIAFVGIFLDIVFDQYVRGVWAKKLPPKIHNCFIVASFCLVGLDTPGLDHLIGVSVCWSDNDEIDGDNIASLTRLRRNLVRKTRISKEIYSPSIEPNYSERHLNDKNPPHELSPSQEKLSHNISNHIESKHMIFIGGMMSQWCLTSNIGNSVIKWCTSK